MVKKVVVIGLLFCVLFMTACGTDIVGNWKAVNVSFEGEDMEYDKYIESINTEGYDNTDITVKISGDGKYEITMMGDSTSGTWQKKDDNYYLVFSGQDVKATLTGARLSIPLGNVVFLFEK